MKICYLADIKSQHTEKWCKYFLGKGYEIHVISLRSGEIEGVTVHSLDIDNSVSQKENSSDKIGYLKKIIKIRKLVKQINPDILHAHYASSYGLFGALCNYHPYVISLWGSDVLLFPKEGLVQKSILKYNFKKADEIFSTSEYMAREAKKYTNKNIYITPFGIDINIFNDKEERSNDEVNIGIVKSLEKVYGIDYLINSFNVIVNKYPDKKINLYIIGKGTQEKILKDLVIKLGLEKKIKFLGTMPLEKIGEFYNKMHIAAVPSLSESFGVTVLEAQACGIPVVVSDIEAFEETTIIGQTSLMCKKKDVNSLVECLEKLIINEDLRIEMGRKGKKFARENFESNTIFNDINKLYEKINSKNK
ncbi:glycosyltransferase [Clostridium gasigenes]|uniref:glycosyltransferase n=1 Tax=Clostridium gasigenes TaxID=94869 RepID=UPI001C0B66B2|nr:glycosyltransferase [Clostridium gasigenes]MBU3103188.1 glycosyltransferase [Clostridium gasigenes]